MVETVRFKDNPTNLCEKKIADYQKDRADLISERDKVFEKLGQYGCFICKSLSSDSQVTAFSKMYEDVNQEHLDLSAEIIELTSKIYRLKKWVKKHASKNQ